MASAADGDSARSPTSTAPMEPPPGNHAAIDIDDSLEKATVTPVDRRRRREDSIEKSSLVLRALVWLFSLLSLILMGSNNQRHRLGFINPYYDFRYCFVVIIPAFLYSMVQVVLQVHRLSRGKDLGRTSRIISFAADQVFAYLLLSGLSMTIREGAHNLSTNIIRASINMAFFAFLSFALSALASGYRLYAKICI